MENVLYFLGEVKKGKVSGFHNWIRFYLLEKQGIINYFSYNYDGPVSITKNGYSLPDSLKASWRMKVPLNKNKNPEILHNS